MYTQVDRPKVDPLLALDLRGNVFVQRLAEGESAGMMGYAYQMQEHCPSLERKVQPQS
jgi:hypothetical protein